MTDMHHLLKLYLVLETKMLKMPLEEFIPAVVDGGVTIIQLRDKYATGKELFNRACQLKTLLEGTGVPLVINDRVDVAHAAGIDFVHIGMKDIPPKPLREAFPGIRFGYSCNTPDDIRTALDYNADYIGVGPAFPTATKADLRPVIGPAGIARLLEQTTAPAVAIGGITAANAHQLAGAGLAGIAVSSALCASTDPCAEARQLVSAVEGHERI